MSQMRVVQPVAGSELRGGREMLYKADHPRGIDRYIDFFGDDQPAEASLDRCGDVLLESLA